VEKTALIIIDGSDSIREMAESISGALSGVKTVIMAADEFDVTQLLAASVCFLGMESPNPPNFSFINKVFTHINLAGRPCGVFSHSKEAAAYMGKIIHDTEAALFPAHFLGEGDVKAWTENVLAQGQKK
jgi:hypothetical protein